MPYDMRDGTEYVPVGVTLSRHTGHTTTQLTQAGPVTTTYHRDRPTVTGETGRAVRFGSVVVGFCRAGVTG